MFTETWPEARVIFSDTKEERIASFDLMRFETDHLELTNVITETDLSSGENSDFDGDALPCGIEKGFIYFDAVDRIEVIRDGVVSVIFEKTTYK